MKQAIAHTAMAAGDVCARYGFDAAARRRRLTLLELGPADHVLAHRLHRSVILPQVESLVERFYDYQQRFPEIMQAIDSQQGLVRLKRTQRTYLLGLGLGFDSAEYFGERLRVGEIHALCDIPLSLYQTSYRQLQQLLIDAIPPVLQRDAAAHRALCAFILKITTLDMSLAIETYHSSQVAELRHSVDILQHEHLSLRDKVGRDPLTGLANRELVQSELEAALETMGARGAALSLMMVDADHFKQINDCHGHLVGDRVLQCLAINLQQQLREFDVVGRFGGEEFIIVLEDTPNAIARSVAERLRTGVEREIIECDGHRLRLTISLGLTQAMAHDDVTSLIRRADAALYQAKAAGRNRVVVF